MDREIRLLGPGLVRGQDGRPVEPGAWRTTKTYDLFRVLAVAGETVPIDRLLDHFWSTSDDVHARASLRTALCQVRKVMGQDAVIRTDDAVGIHRVWVDTTAHRNLVYQVVEAREQGRHAEVVDLVRRAEALYTGDLELGGSESTWLADAREELREVRRQVLEAGVLSAERLGAWSTVVELGGLAAGLAPSEPVARALMRAWYGLGDAGRPVEVFEALRERLAEEYGVDPAPQTRATYLEIVGDTGHWPPPTVLVGREQEVRRVTAAVTGWLSTPGAGGGTVWLLGGCGAGREAVARQAAGNVGLAPPVGEDAGGPVVVLPDQGAPSDVEVAALREAARRRAVLFLVPVAALPEGAVGDDEVVTVPPLAGPDLARLASTVLQGRPTPRLVERLHEASGGMPGRACRLAHSWLHDGSLVYDVHGVDTVGDVVCPGSCPPPVRPSIGALPPAFQEVLVVTAVAGEPIPEDLLLTTWCLLGPPGPASAAGTLADMVDAGLLRRQGQLVGVPDQVRRKVLDWARPSLVTHVQGLLEHATPLLLAR